MAFSYRAKRGEIAFIVLVVSSLQIAGNLLYLHLIKGYSSSECSTATTFEPAKDTTNAATMTRRKSPVVVAEEDGTMIDDNNNNKSMLFPELESNMTAPPSTSLNSSGAAVEDPYKPSWAKKLDVFAINNNKVDKVSAEHRVCFVHIGKTAGTTLGCYLGFRYDCGSKFLKEYFVSTDEFLLPRYTTDVFHRRYNGCRDHEFSVYLLSLRNPLERIMSWFAYEKPSGPHSSYYKQTKPLFVDCYSTLNELAEHGLGNNDDEDNNSEERESCKRRARHAIKGTRGYCCHNKYNYGFFNDQIGPSKRIIAIRTEHLLDDWNSIERMLGGTQSLNVTFIRRNVSRPTEAKNDVNKQQQISQKARRNLCNALCEEIQIYKKFLNRAENLGKEQVDTSLQEIQETCPQETKEIRSCDVH